MRYPFFAGLISRILTEKLKIIPGDEDKTTQWHRQQQSVRSLGSLPIPRGGGKMSPLANVAHAVSASKAACNDGMWVLLPFPFSDDAETYPVYIVSSSVIDMHDAQRQQQ